jgi:outer membrane immunogenic protein
MRYVVSTIVLCCLLALGAYPSGMIAAKASDDSKLDAILRRLDKLEKQNNKLEKENAELKSEIKHVEKKKIAVVKRPDHVEDSAETAMASAPAPMATKAPMYSGYRPFVPNWAGLYVTGHAGAMQGSIGSCCVTGGTAGGGIGYNWQSGRVVYGLEGDLDTFYMSGTPQFNYDASLRGRLGYTFDRILLYISTGVSEGSIRPVQVGLVAPSFSWHTGWTVGGGAEYWATPDLSIYTDYRYTTYDKSVSFPYSQTETFAVRAGASWHFAGIPWLR